jgi:hypothetical protein
MNIICSGCQTKLKVDDTFAGKRGKCPKCGALLEISTVPASEAKSNTELATERQKEYANSLGIEFSPNISKKQMSQLIDTAVHRSDEERFKKLEELSNHESKAWQEMREQVLAEIDEDDCRLSKATPDQIVEELGNRDLGAILISFKRNDIDFENLTGAKFDVSFSDNLTDAEMRALLVGLGAVVVRQALK